MLAGVVFYFSKDDSFESVAAEAKALLLTAIFGADKETNLARDQMDE